MKKVIKLLALFSAIALLTGCPEINPKEETVQEKINAATGSIDLAGEKAAENITVTNAVTIKNLDMGGKTLTVKKAGVILDSVKNATIVAAAEIGDGDLTVKNCTDVKELKVEGGGKNSIHIDGTTVAVITIKKDEVRIVLENKTEVKEVAVKADKIKLETKAEKPETAPKIEQLKIEVEVKKIELAVEKIEKLTVIAEADTKAPEILVTKEIEVREVEKVVDDKVVEEPVKISIDENVDTEKVELPKETVKQEVITVEAIQLKSDNVKTSYTVNEKLDTSNLFAIIVYSNGITKEIELTAADVKGFDSSKAGTFTLSVLYEGKEIGTLNIIVTEPVADKDKEAKAAALIEEGANWLKNTDTYDLSEVHIDEAILCFKTAYEINPTDETTLYYALAELASISTDESVAKLLKENFGFVNYPSTPNALLSEDWLVKYPYYRSVETYKLDTETEYKNYIRVDGTPAKHSVSDISIEYALDNEGDWIPGYALEYSYITDITPSKEGKYLIYTFDLADYYNNQDAYKDYLANITYTNNDKPVVTGYTIAPALKVPDSLNYSNYYKQSLFNSCLTSESLSYLLIGNILDCNSKGFNSLIDNILGIFGTKYNHAKELIESLSNDAIKIPKELLDGLNLLELFEDEELSKEEIAQLTDIEKQIKEANLSVGKQELNIFMSAFEILKGTFQYISSYDLSMNLDYLSCFFDDTVNSSYSSIQTLSYLKSKSYSIIAPEILTVRNADAVAQAKDTYISALNNIIASYEYLIGEESPYPEIIKELISTLGNTFYEGTKLLTAAIKDGGKFYIPESLEDLTKWPASKEDKSCTSIDMGMLFTPGIFSEFIERTEDGKIQLYGDIHQSSLSYFPKAFIPEFTPIKGYKFNDWNDIDHELTVLLKDTIESYQDSIQRVYDADLSVKIDTTKLNELCSLIPLVKEDYSFYTYTLWASDPSYKVTDGEWYYTEVDKKAFLDNADYGSVKIINQTYSSGAYGFTYALFTTRTDVSSVDSYYFVLDADKDSINPVITTNIPETKPVVKADKDKIVFYFYVSKNALGLLNSSTVAITSGIQNDEWIYDSYSIGYIVQRGRYWPYIMTYLSPYCETTEPPLTKVPDAK